MQASRSGLAGFPGAGSIDRETRRAIDRLRFAPEIEAEFVACPALILILAATLLPSLQRHYQWIAGSAVIVTGMSVMAISGLAAVAGQPQFQMGDVLVIV